MKREIFEEIIAEQLHRLQAISKKKRLDLDDIRCLDLLVKVRKTLLGEDGDEADNTGGLTSEELKALARMQVGDE